MNFSKEKDFNFVGSSIHDWCYSSQDLSKEGLKNLAIVKQIDGPEFWEKFYNEIIPRGEMVSNDFVRKQKELIKNKEEGVRVTEFFDDIIHYRPKSKMLFVQRKEENYISVTLYVRKQRPWGEILTFEIEKVKKHTKTYNVRWSYMKGIYRKAQFYIIDTCYCGGTRYALLEDCAWGEESAHLIVNLDTQDFVSWTRNPLYETLEEIGVA